MSAAPRTMLELGGISAGYGHFTALWDVALRVSAGEAVAAIIVAAAVATKRSHRICWRSSPTSATSSGAGWRCT